MEWSTNGGSTWTKISDHGRTPVSINVTRIEKQQRMADGRLRRYVVAKKRSFSCSWKDIPSVATELLANGQPGEWMENFHDTVDGSFHMRFRAGSDRDLVLTGMSGEVLEVVITDFSKEVTKRGPAFDLWNLDITLEEV
jgi:hypothetical protein